MNRIRSLREEAGMSQRELAARLGVAGGGAVSKYEAGKNGLSEELLCKLSAIFDVSVDYILGISDCRKRGTSLSAPNITWDALALVESADALPEEKRRVLLRCANSPEVLAVAGRYIQLSAKSQRRVNEYLDLMKLSEEKRAAGGEDGK